MNTDVLILFLNATLTTVASSVIVIAILHRQYRPTIRRLEAEVQTQTSRSHDSDAAVERTTDGV